jgi:mannose-6-phosphate isomerase-like protein (cupin superfamily)
MYFFIIFFTIPYAIFANTQSFTAENYDTNNDYIVNHEEKKEFSKFGISIKNISGNSDKYEVWHSKIGAHACTPKHKHDVEEIFILLEGEGKAIVGDKEIYFKAPCTLTLPANVEHQIFNTSDTPTNHIVLLEKDSLIHNVDGEIMHLPWR